MGGKGVWEKVGVEEGWMRGVNGCENVALYTRS